MNHESVIFLNLASAEKRGKLTQPHIPIRFGSTYGFLAQTLYKIISRRFRKASDNSLAVQEPSRNYKTNRVVRSCSRNRNQTACSSPAIADNRPYTSLGKERDSKGECLLRSSNLIDSLKESEVAFHRIP